jgi:hypothetical protein
MQKGIFQALGTKGLQQSILTLQRNSIDVFLEKELRGLSPNFHMHVSVSDLYIPTIGLPILLQENMWTDPENICIEFSVLCLCSAQLFTKAIL